MYLFGKVLSNVTEAVIVYVERLLT